MSQLALYLLISIESFIHLYVYYILVMQSIKIWGSENIIVRMFIVPFLIADFLVNIFIITPFFLDIPQEFLVTTRLKRWRKQYQHRGFDNLSGLEQYRFLFAVNVCDRLLDKMDTITGNHC